MFDLASAGHCHPRILKALMDQAQRITLSSRAFHSDVLADYASFITEVMRGYRTKQGR